MKTAGKTGTVVVKPGQRAGDNSSGGSVVRGGVEGVVKGRSGASGGARLGSSSSPPVGSVQDVLRKKWGGASGS